MIPIQLFLDLQKKPKIIVDIGEQSINVAAVYNDSASTGPRRFQTVLETLVHAAVQNLGIQEDQARQFV